MKNVRNLIRIILMCAMTLVLVTLVSVPKKADQSSTHYYLEQDISLLPDTCLFETGTDSTYRIAAYDKGLIYEGASVERSTYVITGKKYKDENYDNTSILEIDDSALGENCDFLFYLSCVQRDSHCYFKIGIDINGTYYYMKYDTKTNKLIWSAKDGTNFSYKAIGSKIYFYIETSESSGLVLSDSGFVMTVKGEEEGFSCNDLVSAEDNSILALHDSDQKVKYYTIRNDDQHIHSSEYLDLPKDSDGFAMWATSNPVDSLCTYNSYAYFYNDTRRGTNYTPTIEIDEETLRGYGERYYVDYINSKRKVSVTQSEEYSYRFERPSGFSSHKNYFVTDLYPFYQYSVRVAVNGDFPVENYKITYNTDSRTGANFTDGRYLLEGQWIEIKLPSANLTGLDYSITSISTTDANGDTINPKIEYRDDKRIAVIYVPHSSMKVTVNTTYEQVSVDEVKMYTYAMQQNDMSITSAPLTISGDDTVHLVADSKVYDSAGNTNYIIIPEFKDLVDERDQELDWESEDRCEYSYQYKWYITVDGVETPLTDDFVSTNDMFYQLEDYATDKQVRFRCKVIRTRDCTDTSVEYWSEYRDVAVLGLGDPINIQGVEDVNTDVCDITVDNIYIPFRGDVDCYIQKDGGAWEQITKTVNNPDNDTFGPATPTNGVNITFGMHGKYFTYAITSNGTYTVKVCKGQRTTIFPSFTYENFGKEHDTYTFEHMLVPATEITSGSYYEIERCKICGINTSVTQYTIDKVTTIALEENAFVYDEVGVVPEVQVSDEQDVDLTEGTDYEVKLYSDVLRIHEVDRAVNPGAYYLVVTGKGHYRFERVLPFVITHAGPENPGDESEPSGESQPTEPSEHHESNESHETHESHDPHEPHDPHEHTHDTEPTKPSEPSEHTHPTKPSEHTEPTKPSEPTKETMEVVTDDPTEPAEPTAMTEGEKQTEPTSEPKTETTVPTTEPEAPASEAPTTPGVAIETEKTRGETTVSEPAVETTVTETTASETTIEETTVEPTMESTAEQTSAETLADAPVIEGDGSAQVNNGNGEFDVQNNDKSSPQTSTALRVGLVVAAAAVVSLGCMALLKGQIKKKF